MIAGLAYIVNENLDKLMIKKYLGEEIMGAYGATYKIGAIMTLFITAFRLGAEPFFFNQSKEKDAKQKYAKILLWFTIVGAVFYVAIVANMDIIASFFIRQDEYFITIAIVPVILLANLMLGIYYNLSIWYKLTDRTKFGMYLSVFGAIITISFNLIMIPKIGFMASAWATVAAYGSMTLASYFIGKKYYIVPYDITRITFYVLFSAILSYIIFNYLYDSFIIKNLILFSFVFIVYFLERKEIQKMIRIK
jgi:O-antigen/teichoic acid export membrane protein